MQQNVNRGKVGEDGMVKTDDDDDDDDGKKKRGKAQETI